MRANISFENDACSAAAPHAPLKLAVTSVLKLSRRRAAVLFGNPVRGLLELLFPGISKPLAGFHFHGKILVKIIIKNFQK